jgi:hypothetical protein
MNRSEGMMRLSHTLASSCLLAAVTVSSGCATLSAPSWPWSKP